MLLAGVLDKIRLTRPRAGLLLVIATTAALAGGIWGPPGGAFPGALLAFGLTWASVVDYDRLILPDILTLGLVLIGIGYQAIKAPEALPDGLIGALAGFASLSAVGVAYERSRGKAGLGLGDAKLFAAGGAWLGWSSLPLVLVIASALALLALGCVWIARGTPDLQRRFAFGPFLSAAIWTGWIVGPVQMFGGA